MSIFGTPSGIIRRTNLNLRALKTRMGHVDRTVDDGNGDARTKHPSPTCVQRG
jgi:hypothetical protein